MSDHASPSESLKSRLAWWVQVGANVAVFSVAMVVLWLALHRGASTQTQTEAQALPPIYAVGEKIDPLGHVDFSKSTATLVMFLREDCQFCKKSIPFYQRLTASAHRAGGQSFRFVVATTDVAESMANYLRTQGINVDEVASVKYGALKVPGTPSLLLIDQRGIVTRVWRGFLQADREREVLAQLGIEILP